MELSKALFLRMLLRFFCALTLLPMNHASAGLPRLWSRKPVELRVSPHPARPIAAPAEGKKVIFSFDIDETFAFKFKGVRHPGFRFIDSLGKTYMIPESFIAKIEAVANENADLGLAFSSYGDRDRNLDLLSQISVTVRGEKKSFLELAEGRLVSHGEQTKVRGPETNSWFEENRKVLDGAEKQAYPFDGSPVVKDLRDYRTNTDSVIHFDDIVRNAAPGQERNFVLIPRHPNPEAVAKFWEKFGFKMMDLAIENAREGRAPVEGIFESQFHKTGEGESFAYNPQREDAALDSTGPAASTEQLIARLQAKLGKTIDAEGELVSPLKVTYLSDGSGGRASTRFYEDGRVEMFLPANVRSAPAGSPEFRLVEAELLRVQAARAQGKIQHLDSRSSESILIAARSGTFIGKPGSAARHNLLRNPMGIQAVAQRIRGNLAKVLEIGSTGNRAQAEAELGQIRDSLQQLETPEGRLDEIALRILRSAVRALEQGIAAQAKPDGFSYDAHAGTVEMEIRLDEQVITYRNVLKEWLVDWDSPQKTLLAVLQTHLREVVKAKEIIDRASEEANYQLVAGELSRTQTLAAAELKTNGDHQLARQFLVDHPAYVQRTEISAEGKSTLRAFTMNQSRTDFVPGKDYKIEGTEWYNKYNEPLYQPMLEGSLKNILFLERHGEPEMMRVAFHTDGKTPAEPAHAVLTNSAGDVFVVRLDQPTYKKSRSARVLEPGDAPAPVRDWLGQQSSILQEGEHPARATEGNIEPLLRRLVDAQIALSGTAKRGGDLDKIVRQNVREMNLFIMTKLKSRLTLEDIEYLNALATRGKAHYGENIENVKGVIRGYERNIFDAASGSYKRAKNDELLSSTVALNFPPPEIARVEFSRLLERINEVRPGTSLKEIASIYQTYIRIHPFSDGTGRSSFVVLDHLLMRSGRPPLPHTLESGIPMFKTNTELVNEMIRAYQAH